MKLEDLGYNKNLEKYRKEQNLDSFGVGRVVSEHRDRYVINTAEGEYDGEIIGNLRFSAQSRSDFPAVGDWVAISEYDDDKVLIHSVFPRKTIIVLIRFVFISCLPDKLLMRVDFPTPDEPKRQ